jgi:hypothetical protein
MNLTRRSFFGLLVILCGCKTAPKNPKRYAEVEADAGHVTYIHGIGKRITLTRNSPSWGRLIVAMSPVAADQKDEVQPKWIGHNRYLVPVEWIERANDGIRIPFYELSSSRMPAEKERLRKRRIS